MALPLALTMGEPAGIGGEKALQAQLPRPDGSPAFYRTDALDGLQSRARRLGWEVPVRAIDNPSAVASPFRSALPVLPVHGAARASPGAPDPADAPLVLG